MKKADIKNTLKRLTWIAILFLIGVLIISAIEKKQDSHAKAILIDIQPLKSGESLLNEGDIFTTLKKSFGFELTSIPIGAINVERVERVLEDDPFVLDAEIYITANNNINVGIKQREPLLRIIDNNGLDYYLDEEGFKMPLSKHHTARVIVATGNIPPHVPNFLEREKHVLKDVYDLSNLILDDLFYKSLIEQIYVSNKGEFTLVPKVGRQKILFGKMEGATDKLWRLKTFYEEAMPHESWQAYRAFDLRYKDQVVAKKK